MHPSPAPALPPPPPRSDKLGRAPALDPSRWEAPGPDDRPAPLLFTRGWPVHRGPEPPTPEQLLDYTSALLGQRPTAFMGSRVGALAPVRAALIAIAADVLLSPMSALAWLFCITPKGASKCADRGRRMLLDDPATRRQLSAALQPLLGIELPQ